MGYIFRWDQQGGRVCPWSLKLVQYNDGSDSSNRYWTITKGEIMDTTQLKRIADALEEILRLVKQDQEKFQKINEKN